MRGYFGTRLERDHWAIPQLWRATSFTGSYCVEGYIFDPGCFHSPSSTALFSSLKHSPYECTTRVFVSQRLASDGL
jgi:hypothetical protein